MVMHKLWFVAKICAIKNAILKKTLEKGFDLQFGLYHATQDH